MPRRPSNSSQSAEAGILLDSICELYTGLIAVSESPALRCVRLASPRARARLLLLCGADSPHHAAAAAGLVAAPGCANKVKLDGPVTVITSAASGRGGSGAGEPPGPHAWLAEAASPALHSAPAPPAAPATVALPPAALACPHVDACIVFYGAETGGDDSAPALVTEGLVARLAAGADVVCVLLDPAPISGRSPAARAAAAAAKGCRPGRRHGVPQPSALRFLVVPTPPTEADRHAALVSAAAGLAPLVTPAQLADLALGCGSAKDPAPASVPNALPEVGQAAAAAVSVVLKAALDALDRDCGALLAAAAGAETADRRTATLNRLAAFFAVPVAFAAYIARTLLLAFLVQTVLATRAGRAAAGWLPPAAERAALGLARSTKGTAPDAAALAELAASAAAAASAWGVLAAASAAMRTPRPLMAKAAVEEVGRAREAAVAARARCVELGGPEVPHGEMPPPVAPARKASTHGGGGATVSLTATAAAGARRASTAGGGGGVLAAAAPPTPGGAAAGEEVEEGEEGTPPPPPPSLPSRLLALTRMGLGWAGAAGMALSAFVRATAAASQEHPADSEAAASASGGGRASSEGTGETPAPPPPAARPTRSRRVPQTHREVTVEDGDGDASPASYTTATPSPAGAKPVAHPLRRVAAAAAAPAAAVAATTAPSAAAAPTVSGRRPGRAAAVAARAALARRGAEEEGGESEEEDGDESEGDSPSPSASAPAAPAASGSGGSEPAGSRPARSGAVSRRSRR